MHRSVERSAAWQMVISAKAAADRARKAAALVATAEKALDLPTVQELGKIRKGCLRWLQSHFSSETASATRAFARQVAANIIGLTLVTGQLPSAPCLTHRRW